MTISSPGSKLREGCLLASRSSKDVVDPGQDSVFLGRWEAVEWWVRAHESNPAKAPLTRPDLQFQTVMCPALNSCICGRRGTGILEVGHLHILAFYYQAQIVAHWIKNWKISPEFWCVVAKALSKQLLLQRTVSPCLAFFSLLEGKVNWQDNGWALPNSRKLSWRKLAWTTSKKKVAWLCSQGAGGGGWGGEALIFKTLNCISRASFNWRSSGVLGRPREACLDPAGEKFS